MTSWSNIITGCNHSCLFVCCRVSLLSVSSSSNWHQHLNELNEKRKSCNSSSQKSTLFTFFFFCCILFLCLFVCPCLPSLIQFHSTFTQSSYMLLLLKKMCSSVSEKWEWKIFQNFLKLSFFLMKKNDEFLCDICFKQFLWNIQYKRLLCAHICLSDNNIIERRKV